MEIKLPKGKIAKIEQEGVTAYLFVNEGLYFQLVVFNFKDDVKNFKVDVKGAEYVWQMMSNEKRTLEPFKQAFDIFKCVWPNDEIFVCTNYDFVLSENKKSSTVAFAYSVK